MFGIPGKDPVTLTPAAVRRITRLMSSGEVKGLRIGVKKGGCAGMEYTMEHATEIGAHDAVVEQDGARVMIAPMAQMFLIGTEIDYRTSLLERYGLTASCRASFAMYNTRDEVDRLVEALQSARRLFM